jgi:hypothetical protein
MARRKYRSPLSPGKGFDAGAKIMGTVLINSFKIGKALTKAGKSSMARPAKPNTYRRLSNPRLRGSTSIGSWVVLVLAIALFFFVILG